MPGASSPSPRSWKDSSEWSASIQSVEKSACPAFFLSFRSFNLQKWRIRIDRLPFPAASAWARIPYLIFSWKLLRITLVGVFLEIFHCFSQLFTYFYLLIEGVKDRDEAVMAKLKSEKEVVWDDIGLFVRNATIASRAACQNWRFAYVLCVVIKVPIESIDSPSLRFVLLITNRHRNLKHEIEHIQHKTIWALS